jgi:hypothetical protein
VPIQNPSNAGLFDAIGRAMDWSEKLYRDNVPSSVRKNLSDIFDAPVPGNPFAAGKGIFQAGDTISEAVTALPLIAKALRSGKATKNSIKLVNKLKTMFGVGLDPVPVNRFQQEAVDYPVSRGGRGGTFFSYGSDYPGYVKSNTGASEGGQYGVKMDLELKNPLFLKRGNDFIGPEIIHTLAPKKTRNMVAENWEGYKQTIDPRSESKQLLNAIRNLSLGWSSSQRDKDIGRSLLQKYLHPRQIDASLHARAGKSALEEVLASSLLNKHGYDSAVSLRKDNKWVESPTKELADRLKANVLKLTNPMGEKPPDYTMKGEWYDKLREYAGNAYGNDILGQFVTKGDFRAFDKLRKRGVDLSNIPEWKRWSLLNSRSPESRELNSKLDQLYWKFRDVASNHQGEYKDVWTPTQIFLTDPERNKAWQKRFAEEMGGKLGKTTNYKPGPSDVADPNNFLQDILDAIDGMGIEAFFEPEK